MGGTLFLGLGLLATSVCGQAVAPDLQSLLSEVYTGLSGHIFHSEVNKTAQGLGKDFKEFVYGEISAEALGECLNEMDIKPGSVFYDLGCGVGKTVVQSFFGYNFQKAVGVELEPSRYEQACTAIQRAKSLSKGTSMALKKANSSLSIVKGDMLLEDISDADVIYLGSTCYGKGLMDGLVSRFQLLKNGTRILSLKDLPPQTNQEAPVYIHKVAETFHKMSWTDNHPVAHYETENHVENFLKKYAQNSLQASLLETGNYHSKEARLQQYVVVNNNPQVPWETNLLQKSVHLSWNECEETF